MGNKSKTEDYLSQLAAGAKANPRFQAIEEALGGRDIADVFSPSAVGFTKDEAAKVIFNIFKTHPRGKALVRELDDLLKVVGKTPKKATAHIEEFRLDPAFQSGGSYHPKALQVFPSGYPDVPAKMASTYAHEAGHGATMPIAGKVFKRHWSVGDAPRAGMDLYLTGKYTSSFEGVAEYIGHHLQRQAGLEPIQYFGHGPEQQAVFEELSKMPSKNPFMNVYRYLQKVMK